MRFKVKWTLGMTILGVLTAMTAAIVYVVTGSVGWSIIDLLGAGIVANAVVRPGQAASSRTAAKP